jgi:hypothetical protein
MKVGLRLNGKAIGIDPASVPDKVGPNGVMIWGFPVYSNRTDIGAWEEAEMTPHGAMQFDVRFLVTNRQLTIDPTGHLQSRPAGQIGAWELLFATTQPDGSSLLYRFEGGVLVSSVLTVEARP